MIHMAALSAHRNRLADQDSPRHRKHPTNPSNSGPAKASLTIILITISIAAIRSSSLESRIAMYVCLCLGVTDGQIREAIYEGRCSYREVRNALEVGTQGGKCACVAKQVVKETLAEVQSSQAALAYPATYAVA